MRDGKMDGQTRQRRLGDVLAAALKEQEGAESYRRRQRQVRRGTPATADRPRPLEFDEYGFPVAQRTRSFVTRVARLRSSS
jgi:hypothetical protein